MISMFIAITVLLSLGNSRKIKSSTQAKDNKSYQGALSYNGKSVRATFNFSDGDNSSAATNSYSQRGFCLTFTSAADSDVQSYFYKTAATYGWCAPYRLIVGSFSSNNPILSKKYLSWKSTKQTSTNSMSFTYTFDSSGGDINGDNLTSLTNNLNSSISRERQRVSGIKNTGVNDVNTYFSQKTLLATTQSSNAKYETVISDYNKQLLGYNTTISNNNAQIATYQTSLDTLLAQVTTLKGQISDLQNNNQQASQNYTSTNTALTTYTSNKGNPDATALKNIQNTVTTAKATATSSIDSLNSAANDEYTILAVSSFATESQTDTITNANKVKISSL